MRWIGAAVLGWYALGGVAGLALLGLMASESVRGAAGRRTRRPRPVQRSDPEDGRGQQAAAR